MRKKIIIDCDPGMDDSMALIMAAKSKMFDILAVTTVNGNYPAEITSKNARKILELLKRTDIPVARGMSKPLVREIPRDPFTHGSDGQAEAFLPEPVMEESKLSAAELLIKIVKENPGEITILALAPMTNLACAMRMAPEIIPMIKEIIAISGAFGLNEAAFFNATGDTPQSEWNVYVDPEAADIVYHSGVALTAIGLDVATYFDVDFSDQDLQKFKESNRKEAAFLLNAIQFVKKRGFKAYCTVIDCMAVGVAIDRSIIKTMTAYVGVETRGELTLGMTVIDRRHHHVWKQLPQIQVAYSAEYDRFLHMLTELILQ